MKYYVQPVLALMDVYLADKVSYTLQDDHTQNCNQSRNKSCCKLNPSKVKRWQSAYHTYTYVLTCIHAYINT